MRKHRYSITLGIIAILLVIGAGLAVFRYDLARTIMTMVNQNTPLPLFIGLMIVLPFTGFPVSIFFVLAGLKLGILQGLGLTAVIMPIHFIGSFFLARALRTPLNKLLTARNYNIPEVPSHRELGFCFLVAALPAPYAVKNYLLPLAGASFRSYLLIALPVQLALAAPFIILGESAADTDPIQLGAAILGFALLYLVIRSLETRLGHDITPKPPEEEG
ncbi:MAG: hypothetical protein SWH61_07620 [Thermodesulfobacteriota bacterium]|nr:hypothetical protein [Thermodesulfobacteriota bacterium]